MPSRGFYVLPTLQTLHLLQQKPFMRVASSNHRPSQFRCSSPRLLVAVGMESLTLAGICECSHVFISNCRRWARVAKE